MDHSSRTSSRGRHRRHPAAADADATDGHSLRRKREDRGSRNKNRSCSNGSFDGASYHHHHQRSQQRRHHRQQQRSTSSTQKRRHRREEDDEDAVVDDNKKGSRMEQQRSRSRRRRRRHSDDETHYDRSRTRTGGSSRRHHSPSRSHTSPARRRRRRGRVHHHDNENDSRSRSTSHRRYSYRSHHDYGSASSRRRRKRSSSSSSSSSSGGGGQNRRRRDLQSSSSSAAGEQQQQHDGEQEGHRRRQRRGDRHAENNENGAHDENDGIGEDAYIVSEDSDISTRSVYCGLVEVEVSREEIGEKKKKIEEKTTKKEIGKSEGTTSRRSDKGSRRRRRARTYSPGSRGRSGSRSRSRGKKRRRDKSSSQNRRHHRHSRSPQRGGYSHSPSRSSLSCHNRGNHNKETKRRHHHYNRDEEESAKKRRRPRSHSRSSYDDGNQKVAKEKQQHHRSDSSSRDDTIGHFIGGPGTLIDHGRYRILRDVGMGTFGRVVQCKRIRSDDRQRLQMQREEEKDERRDSRGGEGRKRQRRRRSRQGQHGDSSRVDGDRRRSPTPTSSSRYDTHHRNTANHHRHHHNREEEGAEEDIVAIKIVRNIRRYTKSAQIEADICEHVNREQSRQNKNLCARLLDRFSLSSGHYCLVFECLGHSLYDYLKLHKYRPFPLYCVRDFARQLLEALDFLHGFGLIHTDLKPENILLVSNEETRYRNYEGWEQHVPVSTKVKVIDFGGATYDCEKKSSIVNTRQYRAPEVILGWGWSYPSDLWSAGCIIAELYLGELLFATHDNAEHLALIERAVGPFKRELLEMSSDSSLARECFDSHGWHRIRGVLSSRSIEHVRKMVPVEQIVLEHDRPSGLGRLLRQLLTIDPKRRVNAREALMFSFFTHHG